VSRWATNGFLIVTNVIGYAVLLLPLVVVVMLAFSSGPGVEFPPPGYSLRWFEFIAGRSEIAESLRNSLWLAILSTFVALALGLLASLAMVRGRFPGKQALEALFLAPLVVPSLIIGVALLQFFSLIGFGNALQRLVLGHLILTLPYTIRSISACLYGMDRSIEEASQVMGASPWRTFRKILLPLLRPGIVVASLFAFIVSFGNINVSVFLISGSTVTIPIRILTYMQWQFDGSIAAISTVLIGMTVLALIIAERTLGLTRLRGLQM
jgi:putative spermidine/putrescine transport system permease protein